MPGFLEEGYKDTLKAFLSSGDSPITALYEVMPYMNGEQQMIYTKLWYFAEKYDLQALKRALYEFKELQKTNRQTGFMFGKYLLAHSMHDILKDNVTIKAQGGQEK